MRQWVEELHLMGVQGKAPRELRKLCAIQEITADGAVQICHVNADLMRAARLQDEADKGA